ncbi:hypothetical protein ICN48_05735 [Polynucleobacter sp. JS-Safj-400b-B2]|jgi:hypothetical protein|uniref:hypothetical protein n=1 Tax=Polynucleobacter sp. JS-Safj-400b-B2 TaxID=2576921 RepID=UPI001C0DA4D4|nr:hypothetical protein [Polynucleobacter sp. JS-Safj-400b-B2]MBU3625735.1 hypothetical protein [Polynucleobacter sp. JS-Safj-400b-B2]
MTFFERIQEFLANKFSFIQYPHIRQESKRPNWQRHGSNPLIEMDGNSEKARLSWAGKLFVLMYSLIAGGFSLILILVACIVLYAIVSSWF